MSFEIAMRYGTNPHQAQARVIWEGEGEPLKVLNGAPSYVNLLDAFGAWPLALELKNATGLPAAASFKHVSPAGAAVAGELSPQLRSAQFISTDEEFSPLASAYIRARGGDRMCSFGDFAAVSDIVDVSLAKFMKREVSDGIIAPGYEPEALEILKSKKGGKYLVLEIDPAHTAPVIDERSSLGFKMYQEHNNALVDLANLGNIVSQNTELPSQAAQSLAVATIALKYAQSNSVCIAYDGQVIGMGAGQQSRVHCARLAGDKADKWFASLHPKVAALQFKDGMSRVEKTNTVDQFLLYDQLADAEKKAMRANLTTEVTPLTRTERTEWAQNFQNVSLSSDAFIPFRDTVDRASRSNVKFIVQTGGAARDADVTAAADEYGMVMIHSGVRWFLH